MARRRIRIVNPPVAIGLVVEGQKREARYFEQAVLNRTCVATWTVHSASAGDPKSLIRKAQEICNDVDQVFVVADADRCPPHCSDSESRSWSELEKLCLKLNGRLILSSPCVEVWFLMHLTLEFPPIPSADAGTYTRRCGPFKALLSKIYPKFDQRPVEDWYNLKPLLAEAATTSRRLLARKHADGVWSEVHDLMRELGHC